MSVGFFSVLRKPDKVIGATEQTPFRFEESNQEVCPIKYDYVVENGIGKVIVYPSGSPVKYLKLRFRGELNFVEKVYGDQWERAGLNAYIEWRSVMANRCMPWFTYLYANNQTACYGIKTGADCFAFWQVDTHGITLFINLTCDNRGTDLKEPLVACQVVELIGKKGEDAFKVAREFSKKLCDNPILPKQPIFGVNNWYWAYGEINDKIIEEETDYLLKMCKGTKNRPYMIIDDGWQINRTYGDVCYIGGPWNECNKNFESMDKTAKKIHDKGANAGLWFRPLQTKEEVLEEAILVRQNDGVVVLDPSHPYTLEKVSKDVKRFADWGFDLIKHDFTIIDATGFAPFTCEKQTIQMVKDDRKFFDNTKTTATILKNLYKTIQSAFGDKDVISCNAFGHLTAGIHSIHRIGNDNSGHSFEWTRRDGINSVMRLPTNNLFYNADPDCAAFTKKTKERPNLDFLRMCALTGMTTLASIVPGILSEEGLKEINEIFKIADENKCFYEIKNYDKNANPEEFVSPDGKDYVRFNWDEVFDGTRNVVDWLD